MAKRKKIKKNNIYFFISALFLFSLLLIGIFYSNKEKQSHLPKSVRIGLISEGSGEFKSVGKSSRQAAELAVKDVNNQGGLKIGSRFYPVELIIKDNKSTISLSESEVKDLVEAKVIAVIGPNISKFAIPASNVSNSLKTVLISPFSTDNSITIDPSTKEAKRYIFRTAFTDSVQMDALAIFAINTLHAKRAAVFFDKDQPALSTQAEFFKKDFETKGGKVTIDDSFSEKDLYFTNTFNSILNDPPDIIFLPAYSPQASNIIKQAHYIGIKTPFLGSGSWGGTQILTECGLDCENYFLSANFSPDTPMDETKNFVSEFSSAYNSPPDEAAALTYDSFGLIFQGLVSTGKIDTRILRDELIQTKNYEGVTGNISFNGQNGDPQKSVIILQIKNGKLTYSSTINP